MSDLIGNAQVKKVTIRARVFRAATGKWENTGIVYDTKKEEPKTNGIKEVKNNIIKWLQF